MFRVMLIAALVAGIVSGVVFSAAKHVLTVPLIIEAETYENTARELLNESDPPATKGVVTEQKQVSDEANKHLHAQANDHHANDAHNDHTAAHSHDQKQSHGNHHANDAHDDHAAAHSHNQEHHHGDHTHASQADDSGGFAGLSKPTLDTLLIHVLTGIIFALLLAAAMTFHGKGNARLGLLWGLAGYLAFFVAPSLGLLPELPSTAAATLEYRQLWWISTVIVTIAGLVLLVFTKPLMLKGVALFLFVIPHIIGAPMSEHQGGLAPEELSHTFMWMTAITNLIFWIVLGLLTGFLLNRFKVISHKVLDKEDR